jgi:hypothetical protein
VTLHFVEEWVMHDSSNSGYIPLKLVNLSRFNRYLLRQSYTLSQFRITLGQWRLSLRNFSVFQDRKLKATISFLMSIHFPYLLPHGTTRLPLDEFSLSEVSRAIFQIIFRTPLVSYAASVLQVGCSVRFARTCIYEWCASHYYAHGELNAEGRNIIYKN